MSGSPKYTTVSSGELRRRQAEVERQQREQRRREEQRKLREAALARTRAAALARAAEVTQRLAAVRARAEAVRLGDTVEHLAGELRDAERAVRDAGVQEQVERQASIVEGVERSVFGLRHQIDVRRRELAGERVQAVTELLSEVPAGDRARFDADGADEVEQLLRRARMQALKDPDAATTRADAAAGAAREHLDRVLARRSEYAARQERASRLVSEVAERLAELRRDAERARVPLAGDADATRGIEALSALLRQKQPQLAVAALPEVTALVDRTERELDATIDRMVERRELLRSIVNAIPETGFEVEPGSLCEGPEGALELRAHSASGRRLAVLVREGADARTEVLYATDAMEHAVVSGSGSGASCGPLLDVIEQLSDQARRDGFEPGAVRWDDDQPPPTGTAAVRRGGSRVRKSG